jgi:hypothetical protein
MLYPRGMKVILPWLLAVLSGIAVAADHPRPVPCDKEGKVLPKVVTRENFTLTGARVLAKFADGLLLNVEKATPPKGRVEGGFQDSVVLVPHESLPAAVSQAVGSFSLKDADAARKQRAAATESGNKEYFAKGVVGNFPVVWYESMTEDPFGKGTGAAQSWEEYQAAIAKRDQAARDEAGKRAEKDKPLENPVKDARSISTPKDLGGTEWKWGSGGEIELRADGTARHTAWQKPGSWSKQADGKVLLLSGGKSFTLSFFENGTGQVLGADGKKTSIVLKTKPTLKPAERESRLQPKP